MAVAVKIYQRETKELTLTSRPERGKGPVGRLRREQEMLPGVVYGHKQEPQPFKIAARSLERALVAGGRNAIFVLNEDGTGKSERAVVREIQYHKVSGAVMHIDFLRINADEEYTTSVPLLTTGIPIGVSIGGGALQHSLNAVDMHCVASQMPSRIEIDITTLQIGDSIHVSDLLASESRIVTEGDITIVSVLSPRLTVDEEVSAGTAVAEEAEAATPAAE
ncbi:MAG: 50S ribosomal protein L25 [bacterium]|nr:50S ribosomal protein L25 [bacterium]